MKNGIRVAVCVIMTVAILSMSLSVFADEEPEPSPTIPPPENGFVNPDLLWQNSGNYGLWLLLDSWGIKITLEDVEGYTQEVADELTDLVVEYLDSLPSPLSLYAWINPWLWDTDFWGNARFNSSMLEDAQYFADWLVTKFNLGNNEEVALNPVYSISGYNLYNVNQWYAVGENGRQIVNMRVSDTSRPIYYFIVHVPSGYKRGYWFCMVSDAYATNVNRNVYTQMLDGTVTSVVTAGSTTLDQYWESYLYHTDCESLWEFDGQWLLPVGGSYFEGSYSDFQQFIKTARITAEGDMLIITSQIVLPADNPDYSSGDSVTIIDGEPSYSIIDFDGHVTVDNLPAIISTGTVSNPGLETFWGFIPVLADQTKDAIVLTRGLIYELPEELVVTFYAVMGGLILFGVIKLMREH